jgi:16S rRNA (guanine966-N2)-methyltransferase
MRIIAGSAKGHHIKAPNRPATRPATDLVRGAIFSMLANLTDDWENVLDLYSGSGAMGIEALSRGAGHVDFVDHAAECCAIIKANLEKTRLGEAAHVYCISVEKALTRLDKEYGIVIMDPPYPDTSIGDVVIKLAGTKRLKPGTIVVVTHSPHHPLEPTYGDLRMFKEHRHGDSVISIYHKEALT